ncbi:sporulation-delaying protein SdpB family protein [Corynebacterium sp. TAE3-ERU16]|uniref:sporulation-delaying protein SdpB family protein n=1 Tax=Corynebacterium sp. TAE3-ERU16 TaxID=2849493 RepID=UPI001DEC224E|nr:sporulation-delaying protein SdpB family protein [Corynebacterium sp. TAE3-ERU16]MBV7292851.1 hypothetical protein [Corynebacterium sp. TAE3-ERU16]
MVKVESSTRLEAIVRSANIQSRFISIGRALIAVTQLSFILFTSHEARFAEVGPQPFGPHCQSWSQAGLYCVVGKENLGLADVMIAFGLILVISGFYPRWTGFLHLYITYTISTAVALPDGGESVALIFVGLLAIVSLSDNRRNCYLTDLDMDRIPIPLQGISRAAIIFGRVLLCLLYAGAALFKLGVADWNNENALYHAANNTTFGDWYQLLETSGISEHGWLSAVAAWTPVVLALLISINAIGTADMRRFAFTLVVVLHGGNVLSTGLVSFSLIMIGCCLSVITPPNRYTHVSILSTPTDSAALDDFVAVKADIRPNPFISLFGFHQAFTRPVVCCDGVATQGRWGGDLALVKIGEPIVVRMRYKLTNKLLGHSTEVLVDDESDIIRARLGPLNGSPFKVEVISGGSSDPG